MEEIDELRWSLCTIAMNTAHLSFECVVLLAERLRWLQEENVGEIDEEELESFLYAIAKGNVFNFQTILHLPVAVQNDTIDFYQMFARDLVIASRMADIVFSATSRSDHPR
ncbi:DnaJ-class chaperone [Escherichia coli]|uniref:DnaJ-class chaperone n=1 Tax=Escherichia coli TaxID=562 RepID=A0A377B2Z1_ECOLX|nr:DnaJ-class chaperone [Escherichia coli]